MNFLVKAGCDRDRHWYCPLCLVAFNSCFSLFYLKYNPPTNFGQYIYICMFMRDSRGAGRKRMNGNENARQDSRLTCDDHVRYPAKVAVFVVREAPYQFRACHLGPGHRSVSLFTLHCWVSYSKRTLIWSVQESLARVSRNSVGPTSFRKKPKLSPVCRCVHRSFRN